MRFASSIVATYFALQRCAKLCCNRRMRLCRGYAGESQCTQVFDNSAAMSNIRKMAAFLMFLASTKIQDGPRTPI